MMFWLCAALSVLAPLVRAVPPSSATLMGVDVYRSARVTPRQAAELFGAQAALYVRRLNEGGAALKHAERLRSEMEDGMRRLGDFAYVGLSVGRHVSASANEVYLTFDVVDARDAAVRMPFNPRPSGRAQDPGGLLARWRRYARLCADMRGRGDVVFERPACRGFYCPWVRPTDEVKAFTQGFAAEVPAREAALAGVLAMAADPSDRAAAAYLLSYSTGGQALAGRMLDAVQDPDPEVRAAALIVLADIASYVPDVFIEIPRLLPALDYPAASDRGQALAVCAGLAANPRYRAYLAARASLQLARLNRSLDPSVRDLAYTVLGMLSGRDYGRADYEAWDKWALDASSAAARAQAP